MLEANRISSIPKFASLSGGTAIHRFQSAPADLHYGYCALAGVARAPEWDEPSIAVPYPLTSATAAESFSARGHYASLPGVHASGELLCHLECPLKRSECIGDVQIRSGKRPGKRMTLRSTPHLVAVETLLFTHEITSGGCPHGRNFGNRRIPTKHRKITGFSGSV